MTLSIFIGQSEVKMELVRKGRIIDFETALYYHNLSDVLTPLEVNAIKRKGFVKRGKIIIYGELLTGLITALDKLLKRNILDTKVLKSYKILGNLGKNSTSYKIAAAFIEGLKVKD